MSGDRGGGGARAEAVGEGAIPTHPGGAHRDADIAQAPSILQTEKA